jgi:hypothetical protein
MVGSWRNAPGIPVFSPSQELQKVTVVCTPGQFEQMAAALADLSRDDLKKRIKGFRGRFKLDFSDEYLDTLSLERLRHLLLAALINAKAEP